MQRPNDETSSSSSADAEFGDRSDDVENGREPSTNGYTLTDVRGKRKLNINLSSNKKGRLMSREQKSNKPSQAKDSAKRGKKGASSAKSTAPKKASGAKKKKPGAKKKADGGDDEAAASSGDEYTDNLLDTYIGQFGACSALGMTAGQVVNLEAWERFNEDERDSLRAHLPAELSPEQKEFAIRKLLSGDSMYFGSPRDRVFEAVAAGLTHPRVKRWRLRVSLMERRHHLISLKEYQNRFVRRVLAWKGCKESTADALAGLAAVGGNLSKAGGPLQALPGRINATAEAAALCSTNEWDAERWKRVLDFRNQETERYRYPERAYTYRNPWGCSVVGPLRRGPALDGGRPREHVLLRNERPSHVTILCIVRDAASRLKSDRGTRADICDLLRDSQYLREGATFQQLNSVVSGALDRLHYEENAPVRYDNETKEWCYLHNNMTEADFEVPAWARASRNAASGSGSNKNKGKKKKKRR